MSVQQWCVWKDAFQEEILAVEKAAMTDALRAELAREKTTVKEVSAVDRHAAVRVAYPEAFQDKGAPVAPRRHRVH